MFSILQNNSLGEIKVLIRLVISVTTETNLEQNRDVTFVATTRHGVTKPRYLKNKMSNNLSATGYSLTHDVSQVDTGAMLLRLAGKPSKKCEVC